MTESRSLRFQVTGTPRYWYLFSRVPNLVFWVNNVRAVLSDVQYCRVTPCSRCSLLPYGASNIYLHYHSWSILNLFSAPKVSGEMDNFLLRMCIHLVMASVHLTLNGNIFRVTSNRTHCSLPGTSSVVPFKKWLLVQMGKSCLSYRDV